MPDVKSMKSQWETAGPVPAPKVPNSTTATTKRVSQSKQPLIETGMDVVYFRPYFLLKSKVLIVLIRPIS